MVRNRGLSFAPPSIRGGYPSYAEVFLFINLHFHSVLFKMLKLETFLLINSRTSILTYGIPDFMLASVRWPSL